MNKITHFEIVVINIERAKEFYTKVFDWKFEKWEGSPIEYWMIMSVPPNTPGAINGGLRKEMGTDTKERTTSVNGFVCTIEVASIDETLQKITSNGGELMQPKMHVPHMGQLASCLDTEGNMFNVLQLEK